MKRVFMLGVLFFGVLFFSGCAPIFNVIPNYDKNKKVVYIDDYEIKDISSYNEKKSNFSTRSMGSTGYLVKTIRADNGICTYLDIADYDARGDWYYTNSALEDVLAKYKNHCKIEKIGANVNFIKCNNNYFITSSSIQHSGYGSKITITTNEKCFNDMKKYFKSKVEQSK